MRGSAPYATGAAAWLGLYFAPSTVHAGTTSCSTASDFISAAIDGNNDLQSLQGKDVLLSLLSSGLSPPLVGCDEDAAGYTCDDICGTGFSLVRSATFVVDPDTSTQYQCGQDGADYCATNTNPSDCRNVDGSCAATQAAMQQTDCCVPRPTDTDPADPAQLMSDLPSTIEQCNNAFFDGSGTADTCDSSITAASADGIPNLVIDTAGSQMPNVLCTPKLRHYKP
jgi:hypothetical protein